MPTFVQCEVAAHARTCTVRAAAPVASYLAFGQLQTTPALLLPPFPLISPVLKLLCSEPPLRPLPLPCLPCPPPVPPSSALPSPAPLSPLALSAPTPLCPTLPSTHSPPLILRRRGPAGGPCQLPEGGGCDRYARTGQQRGARVRGRRAPSPPYHRQPGEWGCRCRSAYRGGCCLTWLLEQSH